MRHDLLRRALTDAESGLPNARALDLERDRLFARSDRYGFPIGTITVTCHGCGTDVLRRFGHAVARRVRAADFLARTGPDEIQVLVTHRDTEGIPEVVDRLREVAGEFAGENLEIKVRCQIEDAANPGNRTGMSADSS